MAEMRHARSVFLFEVSRFVVALYVNAVDTFGIRSLQSAPAMCSLTGLKGNSVQVRSCPRNCKHGVSFHEATVVGAADFLQRGDGKAETSVDVQARRPALAIRYWAIGRGLPKDGRPLQ